MLSLTAQQLEGAIMAQVILDALAAGYRISVDDGEDKFTPQQTLGDILALMGATESGDWLRFADPANHNKRVGWIHFIYGNYGYDVFAYGGLKAIADYSVNPVVAALLVNAESLADALVERAALRRAVQCRGLKTRQNHRVPA